MVGQVSLDSRVSTSAKDEIGQHSRAFDKTTDRLDHLISSISKLNNVINKRIRVVEAVRQSEERYRLLAENVSDIIWTMDMKLRFTYVSPSVERLLGYSVEEHMSQRLEEMLTPASYDVALKALEEQLATERNEQKDLRRSWMLELERIRKDGSTIWTEARMTFLRDENDRAVGVLGVTRDISERKRVEARLAERTLQLERSNEALKRKNAELDKFACVASHDLQEPLRKMVALSYLLRKDLGDDLPDRAERNLRLITKASGRMQTVIQDLLDFSRSGGSAMKRERLPLDDCVNGALKALEARLEEKSGRIVRDELPEICGDRRMLTQLYQNLISNALKFVNRDPPLIHITAERGETGWIFGVKDNGIGVEPRYAEHIFAPFNRLHGRSEHEGTGIGLAICRKVIERHEGKIWVESEPGRGSHFKFTIAQRERNEAVKYP